MTYWPQNKTIFTWCLFSANKTCAFTPFFYKIGPVVQLDRISDFGSEGWGFESSLGHF